METVKIPFKLCYDLINCLEALAFNVTHDMEKSEYYAQETFCTLLSEWQEVNNFTFDVVEED
jgi:hypothetical protein